MFWFVPINTMNKNSNNLNNNCYQLLPFNIFVDFAITLILMNNYFW